MSISKIQIVVLFLYLFLIIFELYKYVTYVPAIFSDESFGIKHMVWLTPIISHPIGILGFYKLLRKQPVGIRLMLISVITSILVDFYRGIGLIGSFITLIVNLIILLPLFIVLIKLNKNSQLCLQQTNNKL